MKEGVIFGLKSPRDPTSSLVQGQQVNSHCSKKRISNENRCGRQRKHSPRLCLRDFFLMRLVFEQIVKPNEMDGMCCTKMHFQYVNNYGNKLAQIDRLTWLVTKPMEIRWFQEMS